MREEQQEFLRRKQRLEQGGGLQKVEKQHAKGKLTARERLDLLFDPDTFVEYGLFVKHRCTEFGMDQVDAPADGVITGFGKIHGRVVYAYAQDATVMGGSLGEMHGLKIARLLEEAIRAGKPVVGLNDSGGGRIQEGNDTKTFLDIFRLNVEASGYIPQLSAIMGPCAGGGAYSPALTDFVIAVDGTSKMFVTGPQVVRQVTGETVDEEALGGALVHSTVSGVVHRRAADDADCLAQIRQMLSFLPDHCGAPLPVYACSQPADARVPALDEVLPVSDKTPYDVRRVVELLADDGYYYEIHPEFAANLVTALARLDGHSVGFVANQPMYKAGSLDMDAADKAAHFINFCDAFGIPLVYLSDVPGCMPGVDQEHGGIIRHGARMIYATARATVPKIAVSMRKMYGGAAAGMCEKGMGPDVVLSWPTAQSAVMGAAGAAAIVFRKQIAAAADPEAKKRELTAQYEQAFHNPYRKAEREYTDCIIAPSDTRRVLIRCLEALREKTVVTLPKKHGNMPV